MLSKETILNAYFLSDTKDLVEVLWQNGDEVVAEFVTVDAEQQQFQDLLQIISLDKIEANTKAYIEQQRSGIIAFHKRLIESGETSLPIQPSNEVQYDILFDFFVKFDPEEMTEGLFNMKLAAFDMPEVSEADDSVKESIRTAETPMELLTLLKGVVG